jgi:hypothetical protein
MTIIIESFIDNLRSQKNNIFDTCYIHTFDHANFLMHDKIVMQLLGHQEERIKRNFYTGAKQIGGQDYFDELIKSLPFYILEIQKTNVYSVDSTFVIVKAEKCQIYEYITVIDIFDKNWLRISDCHYSKLQSDIHSILNQSFNNFNSSACKVFDNNFKPMFAIDYSCFSRSVFEWCLFNDSNLFELEISMVPLNAPIVEIDVAQTSFKTVMIIRLFYDKKLIQDRQYLYSIPSMANSMGEYEELFKNQTFIFNDFFLPFKTDLTPFEPLDFKKEFTCDYIQKFNENIRLLQNAMDI